MELELRNTPLAYEAAELAGLCPFPKVEGYCFKVLSTTRETSLSSMKRFLGATRASVLLDSQLASV